MLSLGQEEAACSVGIFERVRCESRVAARCGIFLFNRRCKRYIKGGGGGSKRRDLVRGDGSV